jgi:hypothetical protein
MVAAAIWSDPVDIPVMTPPAIIMPTELASAQTKLPTKPTMFAAMSGVSWEGF